jgi:chromosome transmission fidelity protein 1
MIDLGRTLAALCRTIPDGVVAFFPSYDYLNQVLKAWKQQTPDMNGRSIVDVIEKNKMLFYETQDRPNTDDLLHEYSATIDSGKGALLLSVVGGKLSEGINFSDKLGRGVIIVGLPFPNTRSAVWQAKIQHIENKAYERASGSEASKKTVLKAAGRDFYENACMRAVNQCIGRAIRHQNDYAAIILIDKRYDTERVQSKLPAWIRQSIVPGASSRATGNTMNDLSAFFRGKHGSFKNSK